MERYHLTDRANEDITEILKYLHDRSAQAEKIVHAGLREAMRLLAKFPNLGHRRDDFADDDLRAWVVYSYVVVYRPSTKPIHIIRVLHGARDMPSALDS